MIEGIVDDVGRGYMVELSRNTHRFVLGNRHSAIGTNDQRGGDHTNRPRSDSILIPIFV